jgi:hypothetical protein
VITLAIAQYLHHRGLVVYRPTSAGGDTFIADVPAQPDRIVVITPTGGPQSSGTLGYDTRTFQIRLREARGKLADLMARADGVYAALHGLHHTDLSGTWVIGVVALNAPVSIGTDALYRPEVTINFQIEYRALTTHRE